MSRPGEPTHVGPYEVIERIAAGGMGTVYLAETREGEHGRVALKLLHPHHATDDSDIKRRFLDEGRIAAAIVHPNVVRVLDCGEAGETVYLALEYVPGTTLGGALRALRLAERGTMPLPVLAAVASDFLAGLQAAHDAVDERGEPFGIVHRDVSPQNILLGLDGRAYVSDFGVAKIKDRLRLTRSDVRIGKTGYMAPEQIFGTPVSGRTDLFAAGVVLWEALAGRRLFATFEAQMRVATGLERIPSLRAVRTDLPAELVTLVAALLELDPERRPTTAFECVRTLRRCIVPASAEEVGAWVRTHDSAPSPPDADDSGANAASELPTLLHDARTTAAASDHTTVDAARPPRLPVWGIALGALALALVVVLAWPSTSLRAARSTIGPYPASSVAMPALVSSAELGAPRPAAVPAPRASTSPPAPSVHGARSRPKPRLCDPPYAIVDGVRRYRSECFPH